jgi:hypothetical protein
MLAVHLDDFVNLPNPLNVHDDKYIGRYNYFCIIDRAPFEIPEGIRYLELGEEWLGWPFTHPDVQLREYLPVREKTPYYKHLDKSKMRLTENKNKLGVRVTEFVAEKYRYYYTESDLELGRKLAQKLNDWESQVFAPKS